MAVFRRRVWRVRRLSFQWDGSALVVAWAGGLPDHWLPAGCRDNGHWASHPPAQAVQRAVREGAMAETEGPRDGTSSDRMTRGERASTATRIKPGTAGASASADWASNSR